MSDSGWVDLFCGTTKRYSAVTWATGFTSPGAGYIGPRIGQYLGWTGLYDTPQDMGWDSARGYFYDALTTTDHAVREEKFVKTFRAVGQVTHLLQDMAVPAHVRNDMESHLFNAPIWNALKWFSNPFEKYVAKNDRAMIAVMNMTSANDKPTYSRLTDFWDTNSYMGSNPTSGTTQGLAEYANANFFSDSTIPKNNPSPEHYFPNPQITNANYICTDKLPGSGKLTKYVSRTACPTNGAPVDHFAAVSLLNRKGATVESIKNVWLDDNVHDTYAQQILPRAVGYSAALLDYFFRGTIELTFPTPANNSYRYIRLKARNTTTTGEDMINPEDIKLVVRYKQVLMDPAQGKIGPEPVLPESDGYHYIVVPLRNSITTIPKDTPIDLEFDLSDTPLPLWSFDVSLQLVYKGQLGNETGAVAVGRVELPSMHGDIELTLPDKGIYGITTSGLTPPSNEFDEIRVNATNIATGTDAMTNGSIELFVQYKRADQDPFQNQPTDKSPLDPEYYYLKVPEANGVTTIPRGTTTELVFNLSQKPLPIWATDVHIYVVYTGQIGAKTNQVAIGYRDIAEPTPIEIINNMDYVCINGSYLQAGSQAAIDAVGTTSGRPNWDIYPHRLKDVYLAFTSTPASSTNYSAKIPVLQPGEYSRVYLLTDYSFNVSKSVTVENIYGPLEDVWGLAFGSTIDPIYGVTNQLAYENGEYIDYYPGMYSERGLMSWWYTHYENPKWPAETTCDRNGAPPLTGPKGVEIPQ